MKLMVIGLWFLGDSDHCHFVCSTSIYIGHWYRDVISTNIIVMGHWFLFLMILIIVILHVVTRFPQVIGSEVLLVPT